MIIQLCIPLYHFLFILFPEQMCLSDRELNEAYQDVQEMFSPGSYCYLLFLWFFFAPPKAIKFMLASYLIIFSVSFFLISSTGDENSSISFNFFSLP